MRPTKTWGLICETNCLPFRIYISNILDRNNNLLHILKENKKDKIYLECKSFNDFEINVSIQAT